MLELGWYKNYNPIKKEEKWYVQHIARNSLSIADIAQHMHEHNTPFTAGTIEGLLKDFVQCVNEQLLGGNIVKIDNLVILKLAVKSNAFSSPGEVSPATGRIGVQARIGAAEKNEKERPVAKAVKLTAVPTGRLASKKLARSARLGWTTLAEGQMDEERRKAEGKADSPPRSKTRANPTGRRRKSD